MQRFASLLILPLFCLGLSALPQPAWSADAKSPTIASIKPLQEWQKKTNTKINYVGSRHGMDLWIATRDGILQLIYTTPDKRGMLIDGVLLGPDGSDVTSALQQEFVLKNPDEAEAMLQNANGTNTMQNVEPAARSPEPGTTQVAAQKPAKSELLWRDLGQAATISFGADDAPLAYMVVDLSCDHCKMLWDKIQPAVEAKVLQIKLLPIAILGEESEARGTALLSQGNPADAWLVHTKGGTEPTDTTKAGEKAFALNQALAKAYRLNSTPILIYRDQSQQKVKMVLGTPNDMNTIWTDLGVKNPPETAKSN